MSLVRADGVSTTPWLQAERLRPGVTALVPAYNEASTIGDTIGSLRAQTVPVEIVVIDDCSTDGTGEVARAAGATVLRTRRNTGSKATAQNTALARVRTEFTLSLDADTTLAPDAVEKILAPMDDPEVAAASGTVVPRRVRTLWERGRYFEYLFVFSFYKSTQDFYGRPFIASGCFAIYRSSALFEVGGWATRTIAEDMDLTWTLYDRGYRVRFAPDAMSYPIEPHNFAFMRRQLRRWNHGFVQNVALHRRTILRQPFLRSMIAVALWDAVIASLAYLLLLPALAVTLSPWWLIGYVIDLPAMMVPVLGTAWRRREVGRAIASLPAYFVMRWINAIFTLRAFWTEWVLGRRLAVFEKGH